MTQLTWNTTGSRIFETGIDRGVLFLEDLPGVAWSGLISVNEDVSEGGITSYYIDGIKYLNFQANTDFGATIEAYTYPDEFDSCIGVALVSKGLFATQQSSKSFNLSYRSSIGNDISGIDYGYKIHLVYGASVEPSSFDHNSISESIEAGHFSWKVSTLAPQTAGFAPTAHFIVDSRSTPDDLLSYIESILYGRGTDEARIPSVDELLFLFAEFESQDFDAGFITETYFAFFDSGIVGGPISDSVLDGGGA